MKSLSVTCQFFELKQLPPSLTDAVLYSASNARVARMLTTHVRRWATTIENLKDKTDEEKQEEIEKLLEEIATTKKLLKYM